MRNQPLRVTLLSLTLVALAPAWGRAQADAPEPKDAPAAKADEPASKANAPAAKVEEPAPKADEAAAQPEQVAVKPLPGPVKIPDVALGPMLGTVPVRRGSGGPNVQMVDASLLPRDPQGIWVLNFSFKPLRMRTVDVPGKGRKQILYLYYRVVNRTGKPRMFVPQFSLITDTGKRFEDVVLPQAVKIIQSREDPTIPLLGAVNIMGYLPPSKKEGIDDAVYGVAVWDEMDPKADAFKIYVRGLSDGYVMAPAPKGGKSTVRYKTLRIDFIRRGDHLHLDEKEIQLLDPAYEWIYW